MSMYLRRYGMEKELVKNVQKNYYALKTDGLVCNWQINGLVNLQQNRLLR